MYYSIKLRSAAADIKAILKKYDIAGVVVLHEEGFGEYVNELTPSYSCLKVQPNGELRLRARLKEDFNDDINLMQKKVKATANMTAILSEMIGTQALMLMEIDDIICTHFEAKHEKGKHTGFNEIDN